MNIIGIDTSVNSNAICLKTKNLEKIFVYTNKKENYKWIKKTNDIVQYYHYNIEKKNSYSEQEVENLIKFSYISNNILKDILKNIDTNDETSLRIEGYNYNKGTPGRLIDLVSIGQSIRINLIQKIPNIKEIHIIAPKRLKTLSCEYAYGKPEQAISEKTGKPLKKWFPSKNPQGIKGGDFTKKEMFEALVHSNIDSIIMNFYKEYFEELTNLKDIVKPIEDINDAIWLANIKKEDI